MLRQDLCSLRQTLGSTDLDHGQLSIQELLDVYNIQPEDLDRIREYGRIVLPKLDSYVERFYSWLEALPEYELVAEPETMAYVQSKQKEYWKDFFCARIDDDYLHRRQQLGEAHARIGLSLEAYFAGMNRTVTLFTDELYDDSMDPAEGKRAALSVTKLIHMDTALVVATYSQQINRTLTAQSRSLMAMSTPVAGLWDRILMLPVVGLIDSRRAQDIMHATLTKISETQAKIFIIDISGVSVVDTAVANHLIKITLATKLMGCECTIAGISPAIAQTIVELGIDVTRISTTATLKDALANAFERTGVALQVVA
jgi:rsbT co-antagonist protein RsbR